MTSASPFTVWLQAAGWKSFSGLVHGFSSRLQQHANDLPGLGAADLAVYTVRQVHENDIVIIDHTHAARQAWHWNARPEERPRADGLITAQRGSLLGIATADCVPVLMVEPERGVVAALHAGWRGTLKAISTRAVKMLVTNWGVDPARLRVALGPSIGGCCYEVSREVGEAVSHTIPAAWRPLGTTGFLDLRTVNRAQCEQAGVAPLHVQNVGPCTFCDAGRFASYRREGSQTGRQLSVIGWRG